MVFGNGSNLIPNPNPNRGSGLVLGLLGSGSSSAASVASVGTPIRGKQLSFQFSIPGVIAAALEAQLNKFRAPSGSTEMS